MSELHIATGSDSFRRALCSGRFATTRELRRAATLAARQIVDRYGLARHAPTNGTFAAYCTRYTPSALGVSVETVTTSPRASTTTQALEAYKQLGHRDMLEEVGKLLGVDDVIKTMDALLGKR